MAGPPLHAAGLQCCGGPARAPPGPAVRGRGTVPYAGYGPITLLANQGQVIRAQYRTVSAAATGPGPVT
eukprot:283121-Hanusia_phi.AAC.1